LEGTVLNHQQIAKINLISSRCHSSTTRRQHSRSSSGYSRNDWKSKIKRIQKQSDMHQLVSGLNGKTDRYRNGNITLETN